MVARCDSRRDRVFDVAVSYRAVDSLDDEIDGCLRFGIHATSSTTALISGVAAARRQIADGFEVVSAIVLTPAERRELAELEGSGDFC